MVTKLSVNLSLRVIGHDVKERILHTAHFIQSPSP